jgi:hypothetical protein
MCALLVSPPKTQDPVNAIMRLLWRPRHPVWRLSLDESAER